MGDQPSLGNLVVIISSSILLKHCSSGPVSVCLVYSYAQSVEAFLEEDEQFADQLKEYYAFGEALR